MPQPVGELGLHRHGHAADPLPEVELMRTLVEQDAAALARPGGAPVAGIVVGLRAIPVGDDPVGAADAAVITALHQLAHLAIDAVCALVEHHAEDDLRVLRRFLIHLAYLPCVHPGRFFHHHMDTAAQAVNRIFRVIVVRHADHAGVDPAAVQQRLGAVIAQNRHRQIFARPLQPGRLHVGHRRQFKIRAFPFRHMLCMCRTHVADTDDTESDLSVHHSNPLERRYA